MGEVESGKVPALNERLKFLVVRLILFLIDCISVCQIRVFLID
jgi:hypothetical protein